MPFPPTAQASYGPTEKAGDYGLETLPRGLRPLVKSPKGAVELRFIASEPVSLYCANLLRTMEPEMVINKLIISNH